MTKPILKPGDVVFFKEEAREMGKKSPKITFKGGTAFGVVLGIVPPFGRSPLESQLMSLMGSAGFIAFDDIANFLGAEKAQECIKKFEEKYYKEVLVNPIKSNLILPPPHNAPDELKQGADKAIQMLNDAVSDLGTNDGPNTELN